MTLQEMMNQITNLGGEIRRDAAKLAKASQNKAYSTAQLEKMQANLQRKQSRLASLQASYDAMSGKAATKLRTPAAKAGKKSRSEILKSREYARAFAYAIRNGLNQNNAKAHLDKTSILYDALTEKGGTPAGSDGGFLVPEDIDHSIRELKRTLNPLSEVFNTEYVTAPTGWRVIDKKPTAGMTKITAEMGTIPTDDQPSFSQIEYAVEKYGLIVPVSNELASDEVANLFEYLSRWFARKMVMTENALIISELDKLTGVALTKTKPVAGIKTALNKDLDPAIAASAVIITNQSGFDALDQLEDAMGRPLIQPDVTNPTAYKLMGHDVKVMTDAVLPSGSAGADIYIGDGREFATLFMREGLEVTSTDIGGNAWKTDSIEVRGITRMGISVFDSEALVRRTLEL